MADIEKVIKGVFEMLQRDTWKDIDQERHRFQPVLNDVLKLLKKQNEVIEELLKVGYPHNFQLEKPHIVNYMQSITKVVKKAVHFRNEECVK